MLENVKLPLYIYPADPDIYQVFVRGSISPDNNMLTAIEFDRVMAWAVVMGVSSGIHIRPIGLQQDMNALPVDNRIGLRPFVGYEFRVGDNKQYTDADGTACDLKVLLMRAQDMLDVEFRASQ